MESDRLYLKYYEARLWLAQKMPNAVAPHRFAVCYAESDWDDPLAAWNDIPPWSWMGEGDGEK